MQCKPGKDNRMLTNWRNFFREKRNKEIPPLNQNYQLFLIGGLLSRVRLFLWWKKCYFLGTKKLGSKAKIDEESHSKLASLKYNCYLHWREICLPQAWFFLDKLLSKSILESIPTLFQHYLPQGCYKYLLFSEYQKSANFTPYCIINKLSCLIFLKS